MDVTKSHWKEESSDSQIYVFVADSSVSCLCLFFNFVSVKRFNPTYHDVQELKA